MIDVRRSKERGPTHLPWLDSRHSFSFGAYYDPSRMGVSALRVINDDTVAPGSGFDTHAHRDMEILSYVKRGTIEHRDNMGNRRSLPAGEFQLMSAGSGISHSEYNPSSSEPLEFLQIWIMPDRLGVKPGYQQKRFSGDPGIHLIASPDGRDGSLVVHQDARLYQLLADASPIELKLELGRTLYVHVVRGELSFNDLSLAPGDGASLTETETARFETNGETEALVFDLP